MTIIDLMEYSSDANAQAAYVTNADLRSNADILDEDMADITDWTDYDSGTGVSSQVTFDSKSCMKLDNGATTNSYAYRGRTISYGARTVFSINIYCDAIGTRAQADDLAFNTTNGTTNLVITFASDGLFIHNGTAFAEVGTNLVIQDTWQEWTFDVNWTAKTVDVYLDKVLKASGVSCNLVGGGNVVLFYQSNRTTANRISYIDWFKTGSDFYSLQSYSESTIKTQGSYSLKVEAAQTDSLNKTLTKTFDPPLDLSGISELKLDMQALRTGGNVKLGLHDTGGTTTEFTPTIITSNEFETKTLDLSGVADADKNAIDQFIITPVNADSVNTIYFDNFIANIIYSSIGNLSINLTPTSIINKIISILGNLSIVLTPNSLYELINQVFEIIGNLNINLIPNSIVSGNYSREGNLNINLLPTSRINKSLTIPSNLLVEFIVHSIINKSVIKTSNLQINIVPNASYIRSYDRNGNLIIELIPNATGNINYGRLGDLLINLSPEAMVKFKHTTLRNNDFFLFFS